MNYNRDYKEIVLNKDFPFKILKDNFNSLHISIFQNNLNFIKETFNKYKDSFYLYLSDKEYNNILHLSLIKNNKDFILYLIEKLPKLLFYKNNSSLYPINLLDTKDENLLKLFLNKIKENSKKRFIIYDMLFNFIILNNNSNTYFNFIMIIINDCDIYLDKYFKYDKNYDAFNLLTILKMYDNLLSYVLNKYSKKIIINNYLTNEIIKILIKLKDYDLIIKFIKNISNINDINLYYILNSEIKKRNFSLVNRILDSYDNKMIFSFKDVNNNTLFLYFLKIIIRNKDLFNDESKNLFLKLFNNSDIFTSNFNYNSPIKIIFKYKIFYSNYEILLKERLGDLYKKFIKVEKNKLREETLKYIINKNTLDIKIPLINNNCINYGLFYPCEIESYILFLYIIKKYKNIGIPLIYPISNSRSTIFSIVKYNQLILNKENNNSIEDNFLRIFKRSINYNFIMGAQILWANRKIYYIHKDIIYLIKKLLNNDKYRFIVIFVKLYINPNMHINIVIYDKVNKTLIYFEPYGYMSGIDYFKDFDIEILYKKINNIFNKATNLNIKMLIPKNYLRDIHLQIYSDNNKYVGDPFGYCLAWGLLFIEIIVNNPDIEINLLLRETIIKIINMENLKYNKISNYIRCYAKDLDKKKNIILRKIGIDENKFYSTHRSKKFYKKTILYLRNYVKKIL